MVVDKNFMPNNYNKIEAKNQFQSHFQIDLQTKLQLQNPLQQVFKLKLY